MKLSARIALAVVFAVTACSKPKAVAITPRSAQLATITPDGVELALLLEVHNPNAFAITTSRVSGVLELQDGGELGRGDSSQQLTIPAQQTAVAPARLMMRWTNLALFAPYVLGGKPLPYRIRGDAHVDAGSLDADVPFAVTGLLTPEQLLQVGMRGGTGLPSR
jgi:LEA14-like dessication related protein